MRRARWQEEMKGQRCVRLEEAEMESAKENVLS